MEDGEDDSMKPNNNPKNRRGLLEFQRRQLELSNLTENEARKRRISANLDRWVDFLSPDLKNAVPQKLPKSLIDKIKYTSLKQPYDKFTLISSDEIETSKFTSYAIIHSLMKNGYVTPSEVKITDIMDAYNNVNGMFGSRQWKDYFFGDNAKLLLVEGSSKSLSLLGSKGEEQFWRELLEFSKQNEKLVIITYIVDKMEKDKGTFIPLLTNDSELNSRVLRKSTFVKLTTEEEGEIKIEQRKTNESL